MKIHNYVEVDDNVKLFDGDAVRVHFKDAQFAAIDVFGSVRNISSVKKSFSVEMLNGLVVVCKLSQIESVERIGD